MGDFTPPAPITPEDEVDSFDCGSPAQTDWLRRYARVAQAADTARVYVTTVRGSRRVVGYYALTTGAISQSNAPVSIRRGTGRYPIPVILLARLGVDRTVHGRGVGRALVRDAMLRVEQAAEIVGIRALLIHAESDEAKAFYQHVAEFEASPTDRLHLLLTLKDLRAALAD